MQNRISRIPEVWIHATSYFSRRPWLALTLEPLCISCEGELYMCSCSCVHIHGVGGRNLLERLASQNFCISKLLWLKTFTFFLCKLTCNYDSCILHSFLLFASRMHLACSPSLHTQRPQQLLIAIAVVVVLSDLLFLLCFLSSNVLRRSFEPLQSELSAF